VRGNRAIVIAAALAAVVIAVVLTAGRGGNDGGGKQAGGGGSKPAADAIRVTFAYSPEKETLLKPLIERFNREGLKADGRPVFVDASIVSSGDAEARIAAGRLRPVAWSPASSLWGRLLNFEADREYVADDNPSIVRTPLVIAMWEPLARALGWPRKQIGFQEILDLALDPRGWAAYGKPQFGRFKLGHTNPDFSTSGLSAVAAEYYAATGKREGLTEDDIRKPKVRREIKAIEQSIVHYGDTTLFFSDQLRRYGPAYASAVAMEEVTLVDFNRRRRGDKLVGLYPAEGTFFSDNPFIVLSAPWVSARQRAGAGTFQRWLAKEVTPERASRNGFRPGDPDQKPGAPVDAAHGADPAQPKRVLSLPQPRVLARIKESWQEDRKPANVMLVVDTSGSMSEENKIDQAKQGLRLFLRQLAPFDRVGMLTFNDQVTETVPLAPFSTNREKLRSAVDDLFPDGETAVYDATDRGFKAIGGLRDDARINAVVVLTDGEDNQSRMSDREVVDELARQSRSEGLAVRVYTIAYGSQANKETLADIANASGGKPFVGDPKEIESVYRSISSFF
jgi:Ca-activated chloride channel family protein